MKRIVRYAALLLTLALVALTMGGCMDYSALTQEMAAQVEEPEATPLPPLTEALIEDREGFYRYYNQVSLNDTMDDLRARFPEAAVQDEDSENMHTFTFEDGFGFTIVFNASGAMLAKVPYYKDVRQLKPIAVGANLDQVASLTEGLTYTSIASMFGGKGLEIMQKPPETEGAEGVQRLFVWIDDNDSTIQAVFDETGAFLSASAGSFAE